MTTVWDEQSGKKQTFFTCTVFGTDFKVSTSVSAFQPASGPPRRTAHSVVPDDPTRRLSDCSFTVGQVCIGNLSLMHTAANITPAWQNRLVLCSLHNWSQNYTNTPVSNAQPVQGLNLAHGTSLKKKLFGGIWVFIFTRTKKKLFAVPFTVMPSTVPENIQIEIIDLQCDSNLREKFSSVRGDIF